MTQPRKSATVGGRAGGREGGSEGSFPPSRPPALPPSVAATIPIANPNRPPPASAPGETEIPAANVAGAIGARQSQRRANTPSITRASAPQAVGLDQALPRRLESLAVAHAGGADRLAAAAAEAGVEMLNQGGVVGAISPRSSARISTMRPRGLSDSSPVAR